MQLASDPEVYVFTTSPAPIQIQRPNGDDSEQTSEYRINGCHLYNYNNLIWTQNIRKISMFNFRLDKYLKCVQLCS